MNKRERRINFAMRFVVVGIGMLIILGLTAFGQFALQLGLGLCLGWVLWDVWSVWWRDRCGVRELRELNAIILKSKLSARSDKTRASWQTNN